MLGSSLWVLRMALRDARRSATTLITLVFAVVVGIAGVVALQGFKETVAREIDSQARGLVGADLVISSRTRFSEKTESFLADLPGEHARELSFASMVYFPGRSETRLVQVNAVSSNFPLYGQFDTEPREARSTYQASDGAIVDKSLLLQFGLKVGEFLRIGKKEYRIDGVINQIPGVVEASGLIAPRVYVPHSSIEQTGLMQKGSRFRNREYLALDSAKLAKEIVKANSSALAENYLRAETVAQRQKSLGKVNDTISRYLSLVAFLALVIGGVGVGGSVHFYLRRKLRTAAILRCLGALPHQAIQVFFLQIILFGAIGVFCGIVLGVGLQMFLPTVFAAFLPVNVAFQLSWSAIGAGAALGFGILTLFSLMPLMRTRLVRPLVALRLELAEDLPRDRLKPILWLLLVGGLFAAAAYIAGSFKIGLRFGLSVLITVGLLSLVGEGLIRLLKLRTLRRGPFALRQGLANLYRPYNQTRGLIVLLGTGVFLLVLITFSREMVMSQISMAGSGAEPNVILFDVQSDQRQAVRGFAEKRGLEVLDEIPIISMRLKKVKGRSVSELLADKQTQIPRWSLTRTYRSTYRDHLVDTEELIKGKFVAKVSEIGEVVPVSLGQRISSQLNVDLGDRLEFDVQGVRIVAEVSSIRKIDWQRVRPNFFAVFPAGVLDDAPQFFVQLAKAADEQQSAIFQRAAVGRYPNISIIDLRLIQETVDAVLKRLSDAVGFLGLLSVATAAVVLIGTVLNTREQRAREYSLLKVLGAGIPTLLIITAIEYGLLGAIGALLGGGLAAIAAKAIGTSVFSQDVVLSYALASQVAIALVFVSVAIGIIASLGIYRRSPTSLLRGGAG